MANVSGPSSHQVHSVGELIDILRKRIARDMRILWFRGHLSIDWDVSPGIWRARYSSLDERNFTNRFSTRAATRHQAVPEYDDLPTWLSLMQHYGLPTRLLDWTRSPLVAAYFAIEKYLHEQVSQPQDAVVWILEPHILNEIEGFGNITPSIEAHMCKEMLKPAFTDKGIENEKIIAVMAAEKDMRMFVQQGCFTIHSDQTPLNKRQGHQRYLDRIVIPASAIRLFASEIDVSGFRKGGIFPDLGNLASELKSRRTPF